MKKLKVTFLLIFFSLIGFSTIAQILKPVQWSYAAKKLMGKNIFIYVKANVEPGWHIYGLHQVDGGPQKTTIDIFPSKDYFLIGATHEPKPIKTHDETFDIDVLYFEKQVVFTQEIKLSSKQATVKGKISYMACNDHQCLPPEDVEFNIPIK